MIKTVGVLAVLYGAVASMATLTIASIRGWVEL